jgi:hypothetical protein
MNPHNLDKIIDSLTRPTPQWEELTWMLVARQILRIEMDANIKKQIFQFNNRKKLNKVFLNLVNIDCTMNPNIS